MRKRDNIVFVGLTLVFALVGNQGAFAALTKEAAKEMCRATVGHQFVQSCIKGGGSREACREQASPKVRDCIIAALNKANGRANVPVEVPKEQDPDAEIAEQAEALPSAFVAPPRTITDIAAILDSEKPDPAAIAKLHADADATAPVNASRVELAQFYYQRGNARSKLGRLADAIADADHAVELAAGGGDALLLGRLEQFAGIQYIFAGEPKHALEIFEHQLRDTNVNGSRGFTFGAQRQISDILIKMGDLPQAETYLQRNIALIREARTSGLPGWRNSYAVRGQSWEADVELHRAIIFEARGQFAAAEKSYLLAEQRRRASVKGILSSPNPPPESQILQAADLMVMGQSRMKAKQGRLAEAEADARRALLARLKDQGKYNAATPFYIIGLANCLVEQGRYTEAEKLVRVALDINGTVGVARDSQTVVNHLSFLASILSLQNKLKETAETYAEIDKVTANWDPPRRKLLDLNGSRIYAFYASGQIDRGIAAAQALLERDISRYGENQYETAFTRGLLAVGYMRAKRDAEAAREFRSAVPVLLAAASESADDDNSVTVAARNSRLQNIVEAYISLLERGQAGNRDDSVAIETFSLTDAIRGQAVQSALAQSSARMLIQDKALADLVRQEQDLDKQVNAQLGTLNNALALPSGQRDENTVKALNATISKLRNERQALRSDIARRFPSYANLIDPRAPSVADIRTTLKPDEALLSFYFGRSTSFVWAVRKEGKVAFAAIPATYGEIASKIDALRKALEPEAALVSDIPPFDLSLAYELYGLLLKPIEEGWKPAKSLIVVTNGALGQLPLSLLPTAAVQMRDDGPLFAGYRKVPWLARTHAVTYVPSASAFRTLRKLPAGLATRDTFIGFGDPYFNVEQAAAAEEEHDAKPVVVASAPDVSTATRGLPLARRSSAQMEGIDSADLAKLPRLPDTASELISIAKALGLDPAKVLYLGKAASEHTVKFTDLSHYRIIDFATHGLVPGELNGLTQPALALTAPAVTQTEGDGLLTMGEILALKLDADWVVLSACNTGAGAGAGAEAASGLGRAFFYAGTRAILVTNWSVHSASARDLVTDLFRRQAADPALSRGEALRQASMALLDSEGFVDSNGKTVFAYAHPLFWAPYSIIGDGGGGRP